MFVPVTSSSPFLLSPVAGDTDSVSGGIGQDWAAAGLRRDVRGGGRGARRNSQALSGHKPLSTPPLPSVRPHTDTQAYGLGRSHCFSLSHLVHNCKRKQCTLCCSLFKVTVTGTNTAYVNTSRLEGPSQAGGCVLAWNHPGSPEPREHPSPVAAWARVATLGLYQWWPPAAPPTPVRAEDFRGHLPPNFLFAKARTPTGSQRAAPLQQRPWRSAAQAPPPPAEERGLRVCGWVQACQAGAVAGCAGGRGRQRGAPLRGADGEGAAWGPTDVAFQAVQGPPCCLGRARRGLGSRNRPALLARPLVSLSLCPPPPRPRGSL